jgi:hypothetical protein
MFVRIKMDREQKGREGIDVFVFMHNVVYNLPLLCSCASN